MARHDKQLSGHVSEFDRKIDVFVNVLWIEVLGDEGFLCALNCGFLFGDVIGRKNVDEDISVVAIELVHGEFRRAVLRWSIVKFLLIDSCFLYGTGDLFIPSFVTSLRIAIVR